MIWKNIALVGIGGAIGSMLRYICGVFIKHNSFPFATLTVNIIGSFIIGAVMAMAAKQANFGDWRLFLATGICGGFTTFSALSWETLQLVQQQRFLLALSYAAVSFVAGLVAVFIGYWLLK
jgi:CrcB protein